MTRKIYRTAQGKIVDLGALQLQNEHVRAVGNMNVNARGDLLDSQNKPIDTRNRQVARNYKKQVTNVQESDVHSNKQKARDLSADIQADIPVPPEDFENDFSKESLTSESTNTAAAGLAGAIARAKSTKQ
jgi:acetylglutamate synthase